jgi:hypothetical protein
VSLSSIGPATTSRSLLACAGNIRRSAGGAGTSQSILVVSTGSGAVRPASAAGSQPSQLIGCSSSSCFGAPGVQSCFCCVWLVALRPPAWHEFKLCVPFVYASAWQADALGGQAGGHCAVLAKHDQIWVKHRSGLTDGQL